MVRKCNLFMLVWWQNHFTVIFLINDRKCESFGGTPPQKSILRALFPAKPEKVPDKLPLFRAHFCQNPGTPPGKCQKPWKTVIFDPFFDPRPSQNLAWSGCFLAKNGQKVPKSTILGSNFACFWGLRTPYSDPFFRFIQREKGSFFSIFSIFDPHFS